MNTHNHGCGWLPWLLVATSLLLARPMRAVASDGPRKTLILSAGESRVIENLDPNSTPAIRVIENPHALVTHNEAPSKLVLLGAEEGRWAITVRLDGGETVTYDVTVHAIRDARHPLESPSAPRASAVSFPVEPPPSPLDAGTGPVAGGGIGFASVAAIRAGASPSRTVAVAEPAPATSFALAAPAGAMMPSQTASAAMRTKPSIFRTDPGVVASGEAYSATGIASSGGEHYLPADGLDLMTGTSRIIDSPRRMRRVSIADTEIADVQIVNPFQLNLVAHKPGFTTLAVWMDPGHYEERQVRVDPSGKQQVMLHCLIAELNRGKLETQGMNYSAAMPGLGMSLAGLPGAVATPFSQMTQVGSGASAAAVLPPGGQMIPLLLSQNLTYGLAAQNSNVLTQSFFQYLENHDLGKILAQPHLLANSGEKAKFVSGGEIPIVIAQALNTSIVFKEFGTKVTFVPTVVGINDIELLVQPEVSEPDYAHGVQMFGFTVPAFVTRRAETLVRLKDNQTLIIAGLILREKKAVVQKVPYLGDLPVAGGLFRNTSWQDTQSDLVMSVTPEIVRPLPAGARVFDPSQHGPLTVEEIRTTRLAAPDAARPRF